MTLSRSAQSFQLSYLRLRTIIRPKFQIGLGPTTAPGLFTILYEPP